MSTISASTTSTTAYKVTADTTGTLVLQTGATPTTAVTIDGSQNVGIGTSSPSTKLNVSADAPVFRLTDTDTVLSDSELSSGIEFYQSDASGAGVGASIGAYGQGSSGLLDLRFATGANTERMRIDSSGNVGIGTSSPACRLDVTRTGASAGITAHFTNGDNDAYIYNTNASICKFTGDTSGNYGWGVSSFNGYVAAYTNGSERARIDSSGNVMVGTTSAAAVTDTSATNGWYTSGVVTYSKRAATTDLYHYSFYNPNGNVGHISTNGSSTTYATSSDYRLKENIQPMTGALATVQQLKPCTYTWKVDGAAGQGFIAHELQAVVPDCVTGEKDAVDADGNPVYQGIDTSFLVATLTAAIQEQQALIQQLTARIETLEAK